MTEGFTIVKGFVANPGASGAAVSGAHTLQIVNALSSLVRVGPAHAGRRRAETELAAMRARLSRAAPIVRGYNGGLKSGGGSAQREVFQPNVILRLNVRLDLDDVAFSWNVGLRAFDGAPPRLECSARCCAMHEQIQKSDPLPAESLGDNLRKRSSTAVAASDFSVSATAAPSPTPPALPADSAFRGVAGVIYSILRDRALPVALLLAAGLYFGLSYWLGHPVHRCALRALTGWPCPGCGLSRAITLMLRGRWRESLQLHPFALYVMLWGVMLAGAALLPKTWQARWATIWANFEARTRIHTVIWVAFGLYGFARLLCAALGWR